MKENYIQKLLRFFSQKKIVGVSPILISHIYTNKIDKKKKLLNFESDIRSCVEYKFSIEYSCCDNANMIKVKIYNEFGRAVKNHEKIKNKLNSKSK